MDASSKDCGLGSHECEFCQFFYIHTKECCLKNWVNLTNIAKFEFFHINTIATKIIGTQSSL